MSVLEVNDLKKSFTHNFWEQKKEILKGASFTVPTGQVTGFLGGNGAGKTTALNCIFDFLKRDSGQIAFFGGNPLSKEVKKRIGYLPERNFAYDSLTAYEFLIYCLQLSQNDKSSVLAQKVNQSLEELGLAPFKNQRLRTYSKGMLQKVGLIQSMIHSPEFIVLDEPMSGLDPDGRSIVSQQILKATDRGASVFFSSHILGDVERLCSHLVIIKEGRVVFQGSMDQLMQKASSGFTVRWKKSQQDLEMHEQNFADLNAANAFVTQLVSSKALVQELRPIRPTLEEVFVKLALNVGRQKESQNA
jgi:ABC-2 type transport system ATP-binding protein